MSCPWLSVTVSMGLLPLASAPHAESAPVLIPPNETNTCTWRFLSTTWPSESLATTEKVAWFATTGFDGEPRLLGAGSISVTSSVLTALALGYG
jgi:hypothetical protein